MQALRSWLDRRRRGDREDCRAGRSVAVIECILNQNVRDDGAACFAAGNAEVVACLQAHHVGILSLPCPEIACLGPRRARPAGVGLRAAMEAPEARRTCEDLSRQAAERIDALVARGGQVLAVLGGNTESPGCAVHVDPAAERPGTLAPNSGIFLCALQRELRSCGLDPPFLPVRDADPDGLAEDVARLRRLLESSGTTA